MHSRRDFLRRAAVVSAATAASVALPQQLGASPSAEILELARTRAGRPLPPAPSGTAEAIAQDEAYWREVAAQYAISDATTNLEAGYWGMMPAPVLAAYHRNVDRVNRESSYFARREFPALSQMARTRTASALGLRPVKSHLHATPLRRCSPSLANTIACKLAMW